MKFTELKQHVIDDWSAHAEWRREAREDYDFFAGDQWTAEERAHLQEAGRAAVTFNRTAPIIDSVIGSEINNRSEVRFIPRDLGDVAVNEVLTGAAQWFRDEADAEEEESDAFQDTIICGLGWVYTRLNTDNDPEGEPEIMRVDPLDMGWDRAASRRNLRDKRRVFWARRMSLAEARDMFPGKKREDLNADWFPHASKTTRDSDEPGDQYNTSEPSNPPDRDEVTIVQVQWRERSRYYIAEDPETGGRVELDPSQAEKIRRIMPGVRMVSAKRWKFKQAFLGGVMLDPPKDAPNQEDFDFQAITGKRDRNKRRWYGLMRAMKDPQRWANKWLSQTLHIMNANAKGGIIAEAGITDDAADFEEKWARPDSVHWVEDGALQRERIQPKPQGAFPAGFERLTEFAISSIRDSTGVNLEMLGLRDANQAGVLEYQRRQSALTILAKMFDALRGYRKRQGRVLLHYITEYLSDGRLVRIVGEEGERYVPLLRDRDVLKYDVIVDESPTSPNQKEMTWGFIQQILPAIGQMLGPDEWALILQYSPLPESFVAKLQKMRDEPDPAQQQAQQVEMERITAELAKLQADTQKVLAEAEKAKTEMAENEAQAIYALARAESVAQESEIAPFGLAADIKLRQRQVESRASPTGA